MTNKVRVFVLFAVIGPPAGAAVFIVAGTFVGEPAGFLTSSVSIVSIALAIFGSYVMGWIPSQLTGLIFAMAIHPRWPQSLWRIAVTGLVGAVISAGYDYIRLSFVNRQGLRFFFYDNWSAEVASDTVLFGAAGGFSGLFCAFLVERLPERAPPKARANAPPGASR